MKRIYSLLLRMMGWKFSLKAEIPDKCVICVAPHTSNWDFIIGMIFYKSLGKKPNFLIKKTWFFFPLNYIFKAVGGFPVDRKKKTSLTEQMRAEFDKRAQFQLSITPEGTRKKNNKWKTGFYYIAQEVQVPITLAYLDYSKKTIGTLGNFVPSGDVNGDIEKIKQFYKNIQGKHLEQFSI